MENCKICIEMGKVGYKIEEETIWLCDKHDKDFWKQKKGNLNKLAEFTRENTEGFRY